MQKANRRSKPLSPGKTSPNEKQQYEERIRELERLNKAYQMEIEELRQHASDSSAPNNGLEKLKQDYLQKLNALELQAAELKKKLNSQSQFSTQRKRVDDATKQSQFEIQCLKAQKVQLQCKMKLESVQSRLCKASLEKEVLQLKKEKRKNDYEVQKLLASNLTLKMVLQRKTEEAFVATKRLREMIESRKAIPNRAAGVTKVNDRVQAIEHELEVTTQLHELCSQYESQIEEMTEEIAKLKEEAEIQRQEKFSPPLQHEDCDILKQDLDIKDLKDQVNGLDYLLRQLRLQKKLNHKDEMQNQVRPLFSDGNHDKLEEKMNTPEMNLSSETEAKRDKSDGLCCSCSKKSLCKTSKCRCRSGGGSCGTSCGCARFKCTNRELNPVAADEPTKSENTENVKTASANDTVENRSMIASHGAKLLESALLEKPAAVRDNLRRKKKPLSDIQNSLDDLNAKIPDKKKNGKKPAIQLVTKDPHSSLPESTKFPDED
ncbi:kinesin-like protein KIN-4C isoform X2 [Neltuma alba]|uniref:kinesin-like protein KIN-4C isoform X2 n=1 Tax=Neltuma alba TaxID=207710 RepID=UPI0010A3BE72|nr:kinesin-like protein KIN-4C isoform X2 [Prosopis alba]